MLTKDEEFVHYQDAKGQKLPLIWPDEDKARGFVTQVQANPVMKDKGFQFVRFQEVSREML